MVWEAWCLRFHRRDAKTLSHNAEKSKRTNSAEEWSGMDVFPGRRKQRTLSDQPLGRSATGCVGGWYRKPGDRGVTAERERRRAITQRKARGTNSAGEWRGVDVWAVGRKQRE